MEYLTENKILHQYQSGYHKNQSTDTCLLYLIDQILAGSDLSLLTKIAPTGLQK